MTLQGLDFDICDNGPIGNHGILDLLNDPFFFGKASVLDYGLIIKLKALEVLIRERRSQLEQVLGTNLAALQGTVQISPLSASEVNAERRAPVEIV